MFGVTCLTDRGSERWPAAVAAGSRRIALLRNGRRHGPLTRFITPWDIGELTRPFVFLGYSEHAPGDRIIGGAQPGIATVTLILSGALAFEDGSGNRGIVVAGGCNWTRPGEVLWHTSGRTVSEPLHTFQLWVELSHSAASCTGESQCVAPHELQEEGPVRVILGKFGRARSPLAHAPSSIDYFHVRLKDGQCWRYVAPDGHNVTWIAVDRGGLRSPTDGPVLQQQIALFGDSPGVIELQAEGETSFVLGSARRVSNILAQGAHHPTDTTLAASMPKGGEASVLGRRLARGRRR